MVLGKTGCQIFKLLAAFREVSYGKCGQVFRNLPYIRKIVASISKNGTCCLQVSGKLCKRLRRQRKAMAVADLTHKIRIITGVHRPRTCNRMREPQTIHFGPYQP